MEKSLTILVVDDDLDVAESLADVLEMEGHDVTLAHSGEEAIKLFSEKEFDIAFMDVMMPGMNGVESFFEIRKMRPDAKVFMMTGYSIQQLLDQAIDHGALGVLNKPVDVVGILDILEEVQPRGIILVADDDPDFSEGIKAMLSANNYNVVLVHDGQEALDKVTNGGVDVLILDLKLPVLDGLEVYTRLKEKHCEVPTVIVTGHAAERGSDIEVLNDMSVTSVLTKPFAPSALLDTLQVHFTARRDGRPTRTADQSVRPGEAARQPASLPALNERPRTGNSGALQDRGFAWSTLRPGLFP